MKRNSLPRERSHPVGGAVSETHASPIRLTGVAVRPGRLVCDLVIPDGSLRYANPELAALALSRFPDLAGHACVNPVGPRFGAVMDSTSLPHLLEHLAISLLVRSSNDPEARFVGTTEWVDESEGTARVELSFRDDLEALRAFNEALKFLNTAVITCSP